MQTWHLEKGTDSNSRAADLGHEVKVSAKVPCITGGYSSWLREQLAKLPDRVIGAGVQISLPRPYECLFLSDLCL